MSSAGKRGMRLTVPTVHGDIVVYLRRRKALASDKKAVEALYYDFYVKGKRYRGSTETRNLSVAHEVAQGRVEDAVLNESKKSGAGLTLEGAIDMYLDTAPESSGRWQGANVEGDRTYQDAKSRLEAFEKKITKWKDVPLAALSVDEAIRMLQYHIDQRKADSMSGRTLVNDRLVISRFFKWVVGRKQITHVTWKMNPAASKISLEMPAVTDKDPDPVRDEILPEVLELAKKREVWPVVVMCLGCGARPAEASRVTWQDVDFSKQVVRLLNKKGKKKRYRDAVMNNWVVDELRAWRRTYPETERPFQRGYFTAFDMIADVRAEMVRTRKKAKADPLASSVLQTVTLQSLRQSACTRAIEGGMVLTDYVQQFGHSLNVAQRHYIKYSHAAKEQRRKAMDATDFTKTLHAARKTVTETVTAIA